jgi:hypothetical protein
MHSLKINKGIKMELLKILHTIEGRKTGEKE